MIGGEAVGAAVVGVGVGGADGQVVGAGGCNGGLVGLVRAGAVEVQAVAAGVVQAQSEVLQGGVGGDVEDKADGACAGDGELVPVFIRTSCQRTRDSTAQSQLTG